MSSPIPQPPGVPLLGNILDVDPNNTWVSLKKLADKYGSIFKIKALGHQIVFVGSAALAEEICDEKRFRKCVTGPVVEIRQAVHDALFTAYHDEPSWGIAHRIMAPLVSPSAVEATFIGARDCASELVAKWTNSSPGEPIDVTDDLKRLDVQMATRCFFDQRLDCLHGPEPAMIRAMAGATSEAMKRPTRPKLLNWLLYQRKFESDIRTMRDFSANIVAHRNAHPTSNKDMLHALLHAKDVETGKSLTDQQIIDEIITLYIGTATTPCFLSFTLYYLLKNPHEIAKARDEIDAVVGPKGQLTHAHLSSLPYCGAILRESLRLSAAAPGFNIEPLPSSETEGFVTLGGGQYQVPKDQVMIIVLSAVNRDPAVFSDPEAFQPNRMLGEAYDKLPSGLKKGFGNGKRECIGKVYAWQCSLITLVSILKDVDLKLADSTYELKMNGAFCMGPVGFSALTGPRGSR